MRAALLTGATHGIGAATARLLAPRFDLLVLHGIEPDPPGLGLDVEVVYVQANFDRLAEVDRLVDAVRSRSLTLDLLVNNAGRPGSDRRTLSADGIEATLQTNYLALVKLTTGLLGSVTGRIVNVASRTHLSATLDLDDLELERDYSAVAAYAHSKLAIVTYTGWLARQLDGGPVEAASLHPGVIATGLLHAMFGAGGAPAEVAARNILSLVERPPGVNGLYFDEDERADPNPEALDPANQDALMAATRALLG